MARCKRALLAGERDVQPEMMPAELDHPGLGIGRLAEEGNVVIVASEGWCSAAPAGTTRTTASSRAAAGTAAGISTLTAASAAFGRSQYLVALNDLQDFLVALLARRRR